MSRDGQAVTLAHPCAHSGRVLGSYSLSSDLERGCPVFMAERLWGGQEGPD